MAEIKLNNVSKIFSGGVVAVDSVSLTIGSGEFLVLVGPSGCGKSTLLRMIAGLEHLSDGTISIGERDVTDLPPRSRDVAMVFQSYALYPHMTVRENLGYGLKVRKIPKHEIRERVDRAAKLLGLDKLLDRTDSHYAAVLVAAKRARQLNSYYRALGEGSYEEFTPPMVDTPSGNYLTISLEEFASGKIDYHYRA